jgi:hypothetical protein
MKAFANKGKAGETPEAEDPVKPSKFLQKPLAETPK